MKVDVPQGSIKDSLAGSLRANKLHARIDESQNRSPRLAVMTVLYRCLLVIILYQPRKRNPETSIGRSPIAADEFQETYPRSGRRVVHEINICRRAYFHSPNASVFRRLSSSTSPLHQSITYPHMYKQHRPAKRQSSVSQLPLRKFYISTLCFLSTNMLAALRAWLVLSCILAYPS